MNKEQLIKILDVLKHNHQHHEDYDEYGGYPDSDLWQENTNAIAEIESIIALSDTDSTMQIVKWQYRWLNPGNNPYVSSNELDWIDVNVYHPYQNMEQRIEDLKMYRFDGKPCYEVRPVYAKE